MPSRPVTTVWLSPLQLPSRIDHVSAPLVKAFACLLREPDRWLSVDEVARLSGASVKTVYRRFANLTVAGIIEARRANDVREHRLHRHWAAHRQGKDLAKRAAALGLVPGLPLHRSEDPADR